MNILLPPVLLAAALLHPLTLQEPAQETSSLSLEQPIGQQGTVCFEVELSEALRNGGAGESWNQTLVEIPGVTGCYLSRAYEAVYLLTAFAGSDRFDHGFVLALPELPGPARYLFQFSWDAEQGVSDGYLNGISLRLPGVRFEPWKIAGQSTEVATGPGPLRVTLVEALPGYLPAKELLARVPADLRGQGAQLFGFEKPPRPIDVDARRGELLFEAELDQESDVEDWIMEGVGEVSFEDGAMIMRSQTPHPPVRGEGHFNFWCPQDFPESFVAEWEFALVEPHGCALFFFAATGTKGEDIFDPALPERNGHYRFYTSDAIHDYHVVYFDHLPLQATGRLTSSLVKCNNYCIPSLGPAAVKPGTTEFVRLRLVKDGAHIQLLANDRISIDFTDPGDERWGPVLGGGKIALRQMAVTVGKYRNLRLWALRAKPPGGGGE